MLTSVASWLLKTTVVYTKRFDLRKTAVFACFAYAQFKSPNTCFSLKYFISTLKKFDLRKIVFFGCSVLI